MIRIDKIIQYAILILLILHSGLFYYSSSYNPSLGASTQTALSMRPGYGDIDMNGNNILDIGTFSANSLSATGTLTIPTSSVLLTDSAGEIGIDLTSDQLRYYGTATRTLEAFGYSSFSYATSSFSGTTTLALGTAFKAQTWVSVQCYTNTGTTTVLFNDGTNYMDYIFASSTVNTNTLSSNNAFTAGEKVFATIGTPAGSPTLVACTVKRSINSD